MSEILLSVALLVAGVLIGAPAAYLIGRWHGQDRAVEREPIILDMDAQWCPSQAPLLFLGTRHWCVRPAGHSGWHEGIRPPGGGPPTRWIEDAELIERGEVEP